MENEVLVLMSTYNGEKYLREQLESVLSQKSVLVKILIRDDGSTDNTISIIQSFIEEGYPIKLIKGSNIGVKRSFQELIRVADNSFYYAMCDQDDIWYDDKLESAIRLLRRKDTKYDSLLYYSNQDCVDADGKNPYLRFENDYSQTNIIETLLGNQFSGCTMVFNKKLMDKIRETYEYANDNGNTIKFMHDTWAMLVAQATGYALYDKKAHMSFRRHGNNVTEAKIYKNMNRSEKLIAWKHKLKTYLSTFNDHGSLSDACGILLGCFEDKMNKNDVENLKNIRDYKQSLSKWIKMVIHSGIEEYYCEPKIRIYLKFLLKVY